MVKIALSLVVAFAACTAEPPDQSLYGRNDPDAAEVIEIDAGPEVVTLDLDPVEAVTAWGAVPISGTGPQGGTVLVDSPAAGNSTTQVDQSGRFCVDVPLILDSTNAIELRGVSTSGKIGEPITVEIRQSGSPPEEEEEHDSSVNLAQGGIFDEEETYVTAVDGTSLEDMVDGDLNTAATLEDSWYFDYLTFRLSWMAPIERIHIVSDTACILNEYTLIVSAKEHPEGDDDWIVLEDFTGGDGDDTFFYDDPITFVTFSMFFNSDDCGDWTGMHVVKEIEAWTEEADPTPPYAPSCSNG